MWRSMKDMPIGDARWVVVEVQGDDGETATAYWTGRAWARAPLSDAPEPLGFEPVRHRLPTRRDPGRGPPDEVHRERASETQSVSGGRSSARRVE